MTANSAAQNEKKTQAEKADKFVCYQKSVQSPDVDVEFFAQAYKEAYGRPAMTLREDFCGTFSVCCEWVKSHRGRSAIGVDLCPETLQWGRENNLSQLNPANRMRVAVYEQDVRIVSESKSDIVTAQNYSFWTFKTRAEVIEYFKAARENLNDQGVFINFIGKF